MECYKTGLSVSQEFCDQNDFSFQNVLDSVFKKLIQNA